MTPRKLIYPLLLVILLATSACQSQTREPRPPEILYGQDVCDRCGMIISEPRFAAALVTENDVALKFDDLGEAFEYLRQNPQTQVRAWFAHDYNTEKWIRGETAYFVRSEGSNTPMGTGVVAFKDLPSAELYASENGGKTYTLDQMKNDNPMEMP